MASGWREPTGMPFYRPVHTGPLAELTSYFFAVALQIFVSVSMPSVDSIRLRQYSNESKSIKVFRCGNLTFLLSKVLCRCVRCPESLPAALL
jgi:hypothetical protein